MTRPRRSRLAASDAPGPDRTQPLAQCLRAGRTYGAGPGAVVAVHGATCTVQAGLRVALTGRSGSGKSTLLHLMSGLERPTAGSVRWPAWGQSPAGRTGRVGVVFQGPSLLPALDVGENVALAPLLAGFGTAESRRRALDALHRLDLDGLAAKLPQELSGGQAQRVAVARVLAARPLLILADEPTGQLDQEAAALVVSVLIAAADELGAALVISTHDDAVARQLPERWTVVDGRLSTPQDDRTSTGGPS